MPKILSKITKTPGLILTHISLQLSNISYFLESFIHVGTLNVEIFAKYTTHLCLLHNEFQTANDQRTFFHTSISIMFKKTKLNKYLYGVLFKTQQSVC